MAINDYVKLTPEELRKLLTLDLADIEKQVGLMVEALVNTDEPDPAIRIASTSVALWMRARPSTHAVMAAVAVEMLARNRRAS